MDGSGCQYLPHIFKARKQLGCKLENKTEYVPTPQLDPAFNAFHYKAVDYILPYSQSISWWYPVVYAEIKTEIIFQGHSVIQTGLDTDTYWFTCRQQTTSSIQKKSTRSWSSNEHNR